MARLLLPFMSYALLSFSFKTGTSVSGKRCASSPHNFCITTIKTYNMETTIYWKSNFSSQYTIVQYVPQYYTLDSVNWTSVSCPHPQWHNDSNEMSCVLLTCATTIVDEYYQIRVEAHGNSSGNNFFTPSALHDPITDNIPSRIIDVDISINSSTSAIIRWRRPVDFCTKSKYCLELKYHRQEANSNNKSFSVPFQNNSTFVTKLDSCSANYLFYLNAYEDELCSIDDAFFWETGPFILPSRQIIYNSFRVRVLNFNATVYWKQLDSCSLSSTQFNVYYKSELSQNWSKSHCIVKTNKDNVFRCEFLTCAQVNNGGYEVQIRVAGVQPLNTENVRVFYPSLENVPDQILQITVTADTSTSVRVAWKLAPSFCSRFSYCLTFLYHGDSAENKSIDTTTTDKQQGSIIVRNLLPYTKYYFYAVTFNPGLICSYGESEVSHGATGPFTGTTLEGVPSRSPVLVCSLCDVKVHGRSRDGTVRWLLPPRDKWNGLPRIFIIQWQEKSDNNFSEPVWNNKTIVKPLGTEGNLTGLLLTVEYFVRVKMCNGGERCSVFSKEMPIEIWKKTEDSKPKTSHTRTIAIVVGVTVAVLVILIFGVTLFLKIKKYKSRRNAMHISMQLPSLGCLSPYEDIGPITMPPYSELSPRDDCYFESTEHYKTEDSSQEEEVTARISRAETDF